MLTVSESVAATLSGSWQWWQGRETVDLITAPSFPVLVVGPSLALVALSPDGTRKLTIGSTGTSQTVQIQNAKRFEVTERDIPAARTGAFTGGDLIWIIPAAMVPSYVVPKIGDKIIPAEGDSYTILDVFKNGWRNWYKFTTRNLVFVYNLKDTIRLCVAQDLPGAGGMRITTYAESAGMAAKVIETAGSREDLLGQRQRRKSYEIHVGEVFTWKASDRLKDQHGNIYQIVGNGPVGTIDNAGMIIEAERVN